MITNFLGKILFPRWQPWQRKREAKWLVVATLVALVFASIVVLAIFWLNSSFK
jgi:type VI protein secretion system component VasF